MKKAVFTRDAPVPIGPFSQAVVSHGEFLFISGTIGMNPGNHLAEGGIKAQTKQIFTNIKVILSEAGYSLSDVVKVNVFLTGMNDFDAMNEVYSESFIPPLPARTTIQVAGLPKNAVVEMELIAVR